MLLPVIFVHCFLHCNARVWSGLSFWFPNITFLIASFGSEALRLSHYGLTDALPCWCTKILIYELSDGNIISSNRIVKGIRFSRSKFPTFSCCDVERMKADDTWLSDSHVSFTLMFVPSHFLLCPCWWDTGTLFLIAPKEIFGETLKFSCWTQHSGQCCQKILNNLWSVSGLGSICCNMISFWCLFLRSKFLDFFDKIHHSNQNLWSNKYLRVFHILDSLATSGPGKREASKLQRILLKLFKGAIFEEDCIAVNIPQVISFAF